MVAALRLFGRLPDGRAVHAVDLSNEGLTATILTHGARLAALRPVEGPNLCVTADRAEALETTHLYHGPVIAPVLNRIGRARAVIDGEECRFEPNDFGRSTLHSGATGTHLRIWDITDRSENSLTLTAALSDGEGGFPGNRRIEATFSLHSPGTLRVTLRATTDAPTLMNPGLHPVFASPPGTTLEVPAESYLPATADVLPTGEIATVVGTPHDYRVPRPLAGVTDHNFCFDTPGVRARLFRPDGQCLEVRSDAPGLQVYDGYHGAVALEPQLWPDAPNHPQFPSILLRPGAVFSQTSDYDTASPVNR